MFVIRFACTGGCFACIAGYFCLRLFNLCRLGYNIIVMVEKKILDTILQHRLIKPSGHIVLGLSGGPDSVCLFHVLLGLSEKYGWAIHPVHINHKLRDKAADADQHYTEELCKKAGCPCRTIVCDCRALAEREKITSEEAGRKVRYEAFSQMAEELKAQGIPEDKICIATAHNADDQAETILFRLLRGTGIDGLSGIRYRRTDGRGTPVVRPLLSVTREEILEYCRVQNLNPCIDETNGQTLYTRNKIRLELIPYLEQEYNPSVKDTMIRLGRAAAEDSAFLKEQAEKAYEEMVLARTPSEILLSGEKLRRCHKAIRRRVLFRAFCELGQAEDITAAQFENCETIVFHRKPSARCDLSKGLYLARVYENVKAGIYSKDFSREKTQAGEGAEAEADSAEFTKKQYDRSFEKTPDRGKRQTAHTVLRPYTEGSLPELRISTASLEEYRGKPPEASVFAVFDRELLAEAFGEDFKERLHLGFRESGDFIHMDAEHRKKIQDYFVDTKVPREKRNDIPLLKIGREVLWILPVLNRGRFTAKYRLCRNTKNVICIEIIC